MKEIKKGFESRLENYFNHSISWQVWLIKEIMISMALVLFTILITVFIIQHTH